MEATLNICSIQRKRAICKERVNLGYCLQAWNLKICDANYQNSKMTRILPTLVEATLNICSIQRKSAICKERVRVSYLDFATRCFLASLRQ